MAGRNQEAVARLLEEMAVRHRRAANELAGETEHLHQANDYRERAEIMERQAEELRR